AKALLLGRNLKTNTQNDIINDFEKHFITTSEIKLEKTFREFVLQINQNEPSKQFAENYLNHAKEFIKQVSELREKEIKAEVTK
ncbi:MAG: nitrite reductase, partial [Bacteroidia bacterium]